MIKTYLNVAGEDHLLFFSTTCLVCTLSKQTETHSHTYKHSSVQAADWWVVRAGNSTSQRFRMKNTFRAWKATCMHVYSSARNIWAVHVILGSHATVHRTQYRTYIKQCCQLSHIDREKTTLTAHGQTWQSSTEKQQHWKTLRSKQLLLGCMSLHAGMYQYMVQPKSTIRFSSTARNVPMTISKLTSLHITALGKSAQIILEHIKYVPNLRISKWINVFLQRFVEILVMRKRT